MTGILELEEVDIDMPLLKSLLQSKRSLCPPSIPA